MRDCRKRPAGFVPGRSFTGVKPDFPQNALMIFRAEKKVSQNISGPFAQYRKSGIKNQNSWQKMGSRAVLSLWYEKIVFLK
jgi:hypothetical protein